ncbi:uncharacterized protein LOC119724704 [Patiria miniata]|uniref:Uncharacterized protein n=1 Tax=Patiria miniata TaxID=46514 RepID=A0A913ZKG4_PATMI|nr:uncharacterized protein LOC119724704 [Patiria miniata]
MDAGKGVNTYLLMVFAILLVSFVTEFPVKAQTEGSYDLVFVANLENPPSIFVAPADTFNFTLIPGFDDHEHVLRPIAIDYDPVDGMVYWTDVQRRSITRAFVDGTGSVVLLRDLSQPEGLALDVENRMMYWTDTGSDLIERATLDGQERSLVFNLTNSSVGAVEPRAIIVEVTNGLLFWTDWGSSPKIERGNTDGTSRMTLVNSGLLYPNSITLDLPGGRMYWCDAGLDLVESSDFLGQNRMAISDFSAYNIHPFDISFYRGSLYWTDFNYIMIKLTLTPPLEATVISSSDLTKPTGLHIHMDTFANHSCVDSMPCGEGERCRQFHDHYQCVCMNGLAGNNCQLANPCSRAVCSNGGSCFLSSSRDDAYLCQCPERYFGTNCELFDDPCTSNPCWNGGSCLGSSAGFMCTCPPEFIGLFCESQSHPHDLVFVANRIPPGIYVAPTDTFNFTLIPGLDSSHGNIREPRAIDYDPVERMVYWTDSSVVSTLNRAFLDGSAVEVLFTDLQAPNGLTLDIENRVMYWTDELSDLIERATLDGQERSTVLNLTNASLTAVEPRGIVVDPANSHLYWTDWGSAPKIERSGTDGSGRRVLIDTALMWPNGISLDLEGGRMYWCDAGTDRIEYSDLLGQGRTVLVDRTSFNIHAYDLFVYYDFIYWTDKISSTIKRVEASGRPLGNYGSESFTTPYGMHIFKANICQQMVCQHGGHCQLFEHHYVCICAQGYSGRNCENDNLPPTFTTGCPSNILRLADNNQRSVPVSWPDLSASDPSTPLLWSSTHRPGDMFSVGGVTMVTYTVTDQVGNAASCNFTVTVTGVGLDCPSNVTTATNPGVLVANVSWALPSVTFNGPQQPVMFYVGSPPTQDTSGTDVQVRVYSDYQPNNIFNLGVTRVTYRVQGLGTQCHFHVIVRDVLPPTFTTGCPSNIIRLADDNQRSVPVSWPALNASDLSTPLQWSFTHRPGDMFSVGVVTMVTYTVTDQAGNAASCNFTVTVTGVGLDCPSNVTTLTNPGVSVANVSWALPSVTFNGPQQPVMFYVGSPPTQTTSDTDLQVRVYSEYQPNTVFNLGATRVTYRVQGLGTQCHFHAIVIQVDNEPPMISGCPGDVIIPAKPSTNPVAYSWPPPVISDNAGPVDVTFGCRPTKVWKCNETGSGIFTFGVTKVMYNATDASGNRNMCQFKITVTAVDLDCPVNRTVDAEPGSTSTSVDWMEPVVTGWDGPTNFTSSLSPGVELHIGSHVVNYRQWFEYGLSLNCSFSVQVIGFCPANTTNDALHGRLMWLATRRGTTAESFERCPLMTSKAGDPLAVRNCSVVPPPDYFQWGNHVPQSCGEERNEVTLEDATVIDVSPGNVNEVVEFLANETSESTESAEDVEAVSTILMNIVGAGSGDTEVTELVIQTVSNVIMSTSQTPDSQTPEVNAGSSSAIVQSVEAQVSLTLRQEGPVRIQQDTIHVEAVRLDPMLVTNGLTFVSAPKQQTGQSSPQEGSLVGTEVTTVVNASVVPQDVIASIQLPASIVKKIQAGNENGSQPLRASFIVYADDTLFKSALIKGSPGKNGSSLRVAGSVVSLTVEDVELVNLTEPVVIQFKAPANNETEGNRTIECVFWDFDLNDGVGDWSTAGCLLARETNDTVSCNCSHATNFAILVNVHGQKETSKVFRDVLNIVTNVGCAISIIALVITLTVYLAIKKLRTGKSRQIFIHMFFAWLILYIVFLAGIDNAKGSGGGCVFVAALLHYFVLSTLMWTAVEARNMYVSAVKVFPEDTPHYMLKACLIAWGSPLIVLTITLAAATDHYGNEHYCFLEPDLVLYLGLLAPIGLILIHNIITFVLVMRSILKVKEASRSQQISKRLQNAVGISTLMGLTWSFGFLVIIHGAATSGDGATSNDGAGLAFELIFCLANSFQGLIVFIMFCVRREEVRTALAPYMKRLCCGRTCDIQVPWKKDRSYDLPMMSESVPSSPSTAHTAEFDMSVSGPY